MLLFKDVLSGDEIISDAYKLKEVDDVVYEVDCSMIVVKDGDINIGANPSAEEQEEALEDGAKQVNNVVYSFKLQSTSFDKKSYLTYLKGYMKAVKAYLSTAKPDRVEAFEKGAQAYAKKIVANFKNFEFVSDSGSVRIHPLTDLLKYTGESMNADGLVLLLNYREDGITREHALTNFTITCD
ncbi:translationally-controlled tumor protein [Rhizoctonia solani AG-1 IA]|uniref:Translationally-controlled tumor protein homolog n=1 Tax=Thanatephorus cucumeris (strain AG1-IA) TaxID=983506 RepID=L8XAA4_THACA|nr:translationally-controlled tumor protein [Rhizoctonia solani AG-1 IA]